MDGAVVRSLCRMCDACATPWADASGDVQCCEGTVVARMLDSRLRGNDGVMCENDGVMCENDGVMCENDDDRRGRR